MLVGIKKVNEELIFEDRKNDYEEQREIVEGWIEVVPLNEEINIILNEEGKIKNLSPQLFFGNDILCGNLIFSKYNDLGEEVSLNDSDIEIIKRFVEKNAIPKFKVPAYADYIKEMFS